MKNDNFDLDVKITLSSESDNESNVTSVSLCTPGCITGRLQGCVTNTSSCQ